MDTKDQIKDIITKNKVVIFMKGLPHAPQCGFSAQAVQCLQNSGVQPFAIDVLQDSNMRQSIKEFSNWPTIPQIYVDGKFIGGCDVVTELYQRGQLQEMVS